MQALGKQTRYESDKKDMRRADERLMGAEACLNLDDSNQKALGGGGKGRWRGWRENIFTKYYSAK